ncbi:hypothetical protein, partial [Nocardioides sp.]|uniref:hypothetical protein n=1 Tax=Nocardioides sp. TaxID=35761 RepID=UPI002D7E37B7
MRANLGAGLLLVATTLVGLSVAPAQAGTGCVAPDTAWVGPTTEGGSASWHESTNWSAGVPTATSVVCVPVVAAGPQVPVGAPAEAGTVTLEGTLTVAGDLAVSTLEGDAGELRGPGTTTVSGSIFGDQLALADNAEVDLHDATLGGELHVRESSRLNVRGDAALQPGAEVDSLGGLFTVTQAGSLTLDGDSFADADIVGGFANHGEVRVLAGSLTMMGAEEGGPGQFSDGRFIGAPGALLDLSHTELRDGAHLGGVTVDNVTVPKGDAVTVAASYMLNGHQDETAPSIHGEGELVLTDGTVVDGPRFGDSLTVTVPAGEVVTMGYSSLLDRARLQVFGELLQEDGLSI